jgi:hypothetical protein
MSSLVLEKLFLCFPLEVNVSLLNFKKIHLLPELQNALEDLQILILSHLLI